MPLQPLLRKLTESPVLWRYLDAFAPRVFGLVFHSLILHRFGSAGYALPAWIIGIFGVLVSIVPDPHGFILVRGEGDRARRLLSLTTPYLSAKMLLAALLTAACVPLFASQSMVNAQAGGVALLVLCAIGYAAVETLWGAIGTVSLAIGNVQNVAVLAITSRCVGLGGLLLLDHYTDPTLGVFLLAYTLPLAIAAIILFPWQWRPTRIAVFTWYGLKKYSLWSQGIGLTTSILAQFTPLSMGVFESIPAQQVGQIAYINRLVLATLVPLQVLQSIVIQAYAQEHSIQRVQPYRWVFKLSGFALFVFGSYEIWQFWSRGTLEPSSAIATLLILLGVCISCWYRFEISKILASGQIRNLLLWGYFPVAGATILAASLFGYLFGVIGLGAVALFSWSALSLSWKWIPQPRE